IIFVGDMFFDRYIRQVMDKKGGDFVFSCIGNVLKEADLVVGNLEGPITTNPSKSLYSKEGSPENFVFTFPTFIASLLKDHNIKIVNLGNNHISNFGREGVLSTHKYLDQSGIGYFGGILGDEPIYRTTLGGKKVSFVSYNQFGGSSPEEVAKNISKETKDGRMVIVYAHWGEEYSSPTLFMKQTARIFSQAGARLVVGSHPHVVLPSEKIEDTLVYYSLGNFIFDQYWEKSVSTGLILELDLKGDRLDVKEHQVSLLQNGQTCIEKI
ncbi:MAG: CapA family protein, partial [Patescibacteria group bacterium]